MRAVSCDRPLSARFCPRQCGPSTYFVIGNQGESGQCVSISNDSSGLTKNKALIFAQNVGTTVRSNVTVTLRSDWRVTAQSVGASRLITCRSPVPWRRTNYAHTWGFEHIRFNLAKISTYTGILSSLPVPFSFRLFFVVSSFVPGFHRSPFFIYWMWLWSPVECGSRIYNLYVVNYSEFLIRIRPLLASVS